MGTRSKGAAALAGLLLVAAACGGGDDDADSAQDGHTVGSVGDDHDDTVDVDAADRCDLGFNTAKYNEEAEQVGHFHEHDAPAMGGHHEIDYTIEEWSAVFAGEGFVFTPETLADFVETNPKLKAAVTGGGLTQTLSPDPWIPMTDPDECAAFAEQVRRTRDAIARYPTVADALAAGYKAGSQAAPGQGAHYTRTDWVGVGTMNPDQPAQLMFSGQNPDSPLIGMAHLVVMPETDGVAPEGFPGDNDRWHLHQNLCQDDKGAAIGGDMTEAECAAIGGRFVDMVGEGLWMLHTWVVPGCESDWGLFSNANPRYPIIAPNSPFDPGCNSGRAISEPLLMADPGSGPDLNETSDT